MTGTQRKLPALLRPSPKPELSEQGAGGLITEELPVSGRLGKPPQTLAPPDAVIEPGFPGSTSAVREEQRARRGGWPAPTCNHTGACPEPHQEEHAGRGRGPGRRGRQPLQGPSRARSPTGRRQEGPGTAGLSGSRSCSRTARRRLGAARREPRRAGGRGTPCLAACAPGRRPARDGTSSMSSGYSSLEEDAEDFFFTARTSFFRRAPQGKPRTGQQFHLLGPFLRNRF
ncbi:PREDICTED: uncharacterized protein LOC109381659 [Hipposideros armiger]|uniref:Uncharacterized protein LOC109381659 n=1 Tax=Hipposideros armiger TaxID=186990 RepID=A0A8B7R4S4_HIPAR|nr:PREDICTED: uncharacterized protein LOC109381659 [Hipposideros armiger]